MWDCSHCKALNEEQVIDCRRCGCARPVADSRNPASRQVGFRYFRGSFATWDDLFAQAAESASSVGPERLINISHSEDANEGVVAVWFWK